MTGLREPTEVSREKRGWLERHHHSLARVLGEAVVCQSTNTFLGARYRRIARRAGKQAIVAVGRCMRVIIWNLLADPETHFHDLGVDYYDTRVTTTTKRRQHVHELEALGYQVTLEPSA